jgi:hypothetical protein
MQKYSYEIIITESAGCVPTGRGLALQVKSPGIHPQNHKGLIIMIITTIL